MILVRRGGRLNGQLVGLDEWVKWGGSDVFCVFCSWIAARVYEVEKGNVSTQAH